MLTLLTGTNPSHPELQPRPFRVVPRQAEAPAPSPPHSGDEDPSSWGCWGAGFIGWGPLGQARGGVEEELSPGLFSGGQLEGGLGPGWGSWLRKGHLKGTASCHRPQGRALCLEPDGGSERVLQPPPPSPGSLKGLCRCPQIIQPHSGSWSGEEEALV